MTNKNKQYFLQQIILFINVSNIIAYSIFFHYSKLKILFSDSTIFALLLTPNQHQNLSERIKLSIKGGTQGKQK